MPKKKIEETVNKWGKLCQSLVIITSVCTTVFIFFNSIYESPRRIDNHETRITHLENQNSRMEATFNNIHEDLKIIKQALINRH